jgi:hypothetical protein
MFTKLEAIDQHRTRNFQGESTTQFFYTNCRDHLKLNGKTGAYCLKASVESRNTTIQSEPFIRSKQDGCSDKTEAYKFWRIFSSLQYSPISAPNKLVDLLTLYYGDYYD